MSRAKVPSEGPRIRPCLGELGTRQISTRAVQVLRLSSRGVLVPPWQPASALARRSFLARSPGMAERSTGARSRSPPRAESVPIVRLPSANVSQSPQLLGGRSRTRRRLSRAGQTSTSTARLNGPRSERRPGNACHMPKGRSTSLVQLWPRYASDVTDRRSRVPKTSALTPRNAYDAADRRSPNSCPRRIRRFQLATAFSARGAQIAPSPTTESEEERDARAPRQADSGHRSRTYAPRARPKTSLSRDGVEERKRRLRSSVGRPRRSSLGSSSPDEISPVATHSKLGECSLFPSVSQPGDMPRSAEAKHLQLPHRGRNQPILNAIFRSERTQFAPSRHRNFLEATGGREKKALFH